jgi:hypothetical protein
MPMRLPKLSSMPAGKMPIPAAGVFAQNCGIGPPFGAGALRKCRAIFDSMI